ncbi:MFS transporter [Thalassobacillus sp. CUG 92003]|uniref:MFS transporter n=1 Tax=Thalassobacillus sp. CUG 92003 TaxID=2736641 RepID=UPI0015E682EB|nr:MFS transporter [Thalassobacillus sp. CUG 92003]
MDQENQSGYFKTVLLLSSAVWLVVMNTTMFNVALPNILTEFSLQPSEGAWIVSGYSIVLAIFTITYTRLSDYLPIRKLLITGITIFGSASLAGFFADSFLWLMGARLAQAAGAAAIPGLSMVFAGRFIPFNRRGRAMALIASASSLGFGLGPVVGGAITDYLNWNYLFMVTVLVMLVIPILFRLMPSEPSQQGRFDLLGALLTGGGVTLFLLYISTFHWYFLTAGIVLIFMLWLRINRTDAPFIQPELLRRTPYRWLLYMTYFVFATHFAMLFLIPIMLQQVYEHEPAAIGLIIFPGAMLSAVAAIFVGRLMDRFGNITVMALAQGVLILSTLLLFSLGAVNVYMIMLAYMFTSFGFSSLSSSSTNEVSRILPDPEIGAGIGMKQQTHFIGSASGSVLAGILLETSTKPYHADAFLLPFATLIMLMLLSLVSYLMYVKKSAGVQS